MKQLRGTINSAASSDRHQNLVVSKTPQTKKVHFEKISFENGEKKTKWGKKQYQKHLVPKKIHFDVVIAVRLLELLSY